MITGTGVHDRPELAFTIDWNECSRSTGIGVHDPPERASTVRSSRSSTRVGAQVRSRSSTDGRKVTRRFTTLGAGLLSLSSPVPPPNRWPWPRARRRFLSALLGQSVINSKAGPGKPDPQGTRRVDSGPFSVPPVPVRASLAPPTGAGTLQVNSSTADHEQLGEHRPIHLHCRKNVGSADTKQQHAVRRLQRAHHPPVLLQHQSRSAPRCHRVRQNRGSHLEASPAHQAIHTPPPRSRPLSRAAPPAAVQPLRLSRSLSGSHGRTRVSESPAAS